MAQARHDRVVAPRGEVLSDNEIGIRLLEKIEERRFDDLLRDNAVYGVLPEGTSLDTLREKGAVRFTG